jgi:hypothetical protein
MVLSAVVTLQKVSNGKYQSTREFTHDTEWILHNCIIYNGGECTACQGHGPAGSVPLVEGKS